MSRQGHEPPLGRRLRWVVRSSLKLGYHLKFLVCRWRLCRNRTLVVAVAEVKQRRGRMELRADLFRASADEMPRNSLEG
jgi:hypothetical protein